MQVISTPAWSRKVRHTEKLLTKIFAQILCHVLIEQSIMISYYDDIWLINIKLTN